MEPTPIRRIGLKTALKVLITKHRDILAAKEQDWMFSAYITSPRAHERAKAHKMVKEACKWKNILSRILEENFFERKFRTMCLRAGDGRAISSCVEVQAMLQEIGKWFNTANVNIHSLEKRSRKTLQQKEVITHGTSPTHQPHSH